MTDRLDEIRKRLEAAPPWPWTWRGKSDSLHQPPAPPHENYPFGARILQPTYEYDAGAGIEMSESVANLIAHAPQDIAYLLAEVERLSDLLQACAEGKSHALAEVERLQGKLHKWHKWGETA